MKKSRAYSVRDYLVQNGLSYWLLPKKWEIKIYRTIIFPHILHGNKTWSLIFIGEQCLGMLENRDLTKDFGFNCNERGGGEIFLLPDYHWVQCRLLSKGYCRLYPQG